MLLFNETGIHDDLWAALEEHEPFIRTIIADVYTRLDEHYPKRETRDYEAALLYIMARQYNAPGARIVEIGTCWGWTAAVMQTAAPLAHIITCTPSPNHIVIARRNLEPNFPRVEVFGGRSVDLLPQLAPDSVDMVFVDGDHQHVADDLPFYNVLKPGGLMIHHDYCPDKPLCTGPRPCRWVYDTVNSFSARLAHEPDVLMVDHNKEGIAGHYRREGEVWL